MSKHSSVLKYQKGLSLVELMVSILLGALLLFGVFQIFSSNQQTSRLSNAFARVQEGGLIAMEIIARDIRMADSWGCAPGYAGIESVMIASGSYVAALDPTVGTPIAGDDGDGEADGYGSFGGLDVIGGTDWITLKGSTRVPGVVIESPFYSDVASDAEIYIDGSIDDDEMLIIADCNGGDAFISQTSDGNELSYDGGANDGSELSQEYNASAAILMPFSRSYFIAESGGRRSLYLQDGGNAPQELVPDVQDMEILYGVDAGTDGSVDNFGDADTVNMDRVISVRITLTVNSANTVVENDGQPMSRDYTVTANIRNRSL